VTHWSTRLLGAHLGVSNYTVAKAWQRWGLKPWRRQTFKFSTDPELEAKIRDVVGLYLEPPEKAVVLCVDEKSQIQALDRTAPILPLRPGLPEKATHDYRRHGTTTLFAALEVATGKVTDACYPRHRSDEFLRFLKLVAKTYPRVRLHVVVDNYAAHKHPRVNAWLARNPRITLHFTPTSGSWLNMVEIFFGIITRQAIRRGTFTSVPDLIGAIRTFTDGWNDRCQPFAWTKTADQILPHATGGQLARYPPSGRAGSWSPICQAPPPSPETINTMLAGIAFGPGPSLATMPGTSASGSRAALDFERAQRRTLHCMRYITIGSTWPTDWWQRECLPALRINWKVP
jgi:transposase